jgi:pimeloyl-ACP methyl ester carboxylesterase
MEALGSAPVPPATAAAAFYDTHAATRWLRRGLKAAQRLSPALAVRAAQALFCTPLPPKWVSRRQGVPAGFGVERWPFEDASLVLYRPLAAVPGAPVVLLVHGWGGNGLQWSALAAALLERGLAPVMLDFPAHGRAAGWRSNLPQFGRALEYVVQRLGQAGSHHPGGALQLQARPLHAVVAHSLGATAAAMACARGATVQRLVLAAPAGSPLNYTRGFAAVFGLREAVRRAMQERIEAQEGMLMAGYEAADLAPRLALPVLVVHDEDDRVNPFADGQAYAARAPQARLVSTRRLGHRKPLRDAQVLEQVAGFLVAP